jgi:hypothetical protein
MKLNVKSNHYSRKGNINNIRYDKNRIQCLGLEECGPHHHFIAELTLNSNHSPNLFYIRQHFSYIIVDGYKCGEKLEYQEKT